MANNPPNDINIEGDVSGGNINIGGTQHFHAPVSIQSYTANSPLPQDLPEIALETVIQAFNAATARLANIRGTFSDTSIRIVRREIGQLLDWINSPASDQGKPQKLALVTGKPGQGKSVVIQQLVETLRSTGRTTLGIKADDLAGVNKAILSLGDLQYLLQLPDSIENCVKTAASDGLCIVLIDQLDTLALTLNTDEQSLRIVVNLIDRLREIPNVKMIVSCRDFERINDPVLGGIKIDQVFRVGELQESEINQVLQQINQPPMQELPKPLRHLLKTPLYLDIYVRIAVSGEASNFTQITTLQDLYGRLWTLRIERSALNAPSPSERRQAVFHLVDLMQQHRKLKLHVSSLDEYPAVRQYLLRTGFIQEEGHNLSFLHQTLFSYCYARKFVSSQRSLSSEVFASPQGFFERQLVVEVLQHLRSTDLQTYHAECVALLFPTEGRYTRYHLLLLLLKWLAWQVEPTGEEYSLMLLLERTNFDDFQRWLSVTGNNEGWFQKLKGEIPRWLANRDNRAVTMAINYLANFRDTNTDFVIDQVKPYLDQSQEWNRRVAWLVTHIDRWESAEGALELLIHLVRKGDISIQESTHTLVAMAKSNVIAGCRLFRLHAELAFQIYQDKKSKQTDQNSRPLPEDALRETIDSWEARSFISVVTQSNPQAILDYLFPWFIDTAIRLSEERGQNKRFYPSNWFFNSLDEFLFPIHARDGISLAEGISQAFGYLARTNPVAFRKEVFRLAPTNVRIIQQLLLRSFLADPFEYAVDIYDFLTADSRRLYIQPDAHLLVGAAYLGADKSLRKKWEGFIFSLSLSEIDNEEKSLENWRRRYRWRQQDQLDLLLSIDESLLSDTARRRKYEILRLPEFKSYKPYDGHRGEEFSKVPEPVPPSRQKKLSDEDWLRIMQRYNDETSWGKSRSRISEGGIEQMSQSMVEQVKANPKRFYLLTQKFDEHISTDYIVAIIQGLADKDTNAPPEWIFDIVRRFHSRIKGYSRISVSDTLARFAHAGVPDDLINVLISWIGEDPDPDCEKERGQIREIISQTTPFSDGLLNRAINSVRGSALEDVCLILFHKEPVQLEKIYVIIQRGINDECASVRTMAVQQMANWHNKSHDNERSIQLLETAISGHPILLTAFPVHRYLNWLSFIEPQRALPYLQAMLEIPHENTQYVAAQLICVAGLYEMEGFTALVTNLHQNENPAIRRGAAVIYAQEIDVPEKTSICCERLLILMQDDEEQVRIQTTSCFNKLQAEHLIPLQNFFRQFIKTSALQHGGDNFIEYLTRIGIATPEEQHLSLSLVKDLLDVAGIDIGNYGRGFLTLQREMTLFLRNLYDKTIDPQLRENIMNLFDMMLRLGSDEALKMLHSEDAEWLPRL